MAGDPVSVNAIPAVATAGHPIQNNNQAEFSSGNLYTSPPNKISQYAGWLSGACIGSRMAEAIKNDPKMMAQLEEGGVKVEVFESLFQNIMGEMMKDASDISVVAEDDDEEKSAISSIFE
jgi:hypothetical protein